MIEESVVKILKEKEKSKTFKDSDVVNVGTRKYRATFAKLISLDDLDKLEVDKITAKALVNKDKVIPKINPSEQIDKGVSAGTLYLKIKGREFIGKNPPDTQEARKLYIGILQWYYDLIIETVSQKEFWAANTAFNDGVVRKSLLIANPAAEGEIQEQKEFMEIEKGKIEDYDKQYEEAQEKLRQWRRDNEVGTYATDHEYIKDKVGEEKLHEYMKLEMYKDSIHELRHAAYNYNARGRLPIEIAFLKESNIGNSGDKIISELFGDKFFSFINKYNGNFKAVAEAREQSNLYDPYTKEEYEIDYELHIKPLEESIANKKEWVAYLSDESKTLTEKMDYATTPPHIIHWGWGRGRNRKEIPYFRKENDFGKVRQLINSGVESWRGDINKKGGEITLLKEKYKIRDNDYSWVGQKKDRGEIKRTELTVNSFIPLSYIKRVGGTLIKDEDLDTSEKVHEFYKNILGIKSVTFGNYLPDDERREHTKKFAGALLDMCQALNYDVMEFTGLGNLKMTFAASGQGGNAVAHFEPNNNSINITRKRGDGSTAHECFHYYENNLEKKYPKDRGTYPRHSPMASYIENDSKNISNEPIQLAMSNLMQFIIRGALVNNLTKKLEGTFEGEFAPLKPLMEEFVDSMYRATVLVSVPAYTKDNIDKEHETIEEQIEALKKFTPEYFKYAYYKNSKNAQKDIGAIIHAFGLKEYQVSFSNEPYSKYRWDNTAYTSTQFYCRSEAMKSKYWVMHHELFARAGECYMADKLSREGKYNNYLVSGGLFDNASGVYPNGVERDILFILYDKLFAVIKKEMDIADYKPFRSETVDEYIELSKDEKKDEEVASVEVVTEPESDIQKVEVKHEDKVIETVELKKEESKFKELLQHKSKDFNYFVATNGEVIVITPHHYGSGTHGESVTIPINEVTSYKNINEDLKQAILKKLNIRVVSQVSTTEVKEFSPDDIPKELMRDLAEAIIQYRAADRMGEERYKKSVDEEIKLYVSQIKELSARIVNVFCNPTREGKELLIQYVNKNGGTTSYYTDCDIPIIETVSTPEKTLDDKLRHLLSLLQKGKKFKDGGNVDSDIIKNLFTFAHKKTEFKGGGKVPCGCDH